MRYLSVLLATPPGSPPPPELFAAIMALGQEAGAAGVLLDMGGLAPQTRTDIAVSGGELSILDGPFTETKELVSYAVYEVRTQEEAVEWSRRFMALHAEHWPGWSGTTQVLQVMGGGDPPA